MRLTVRSWAPHALFFLTFSCSLSALGAPLSSPSAGSDPLASIERSAPQLDSPFLKLQPLARSSFASMADGSRFELIDLNPSIGRQLLLRQIRPGQPDRFAHLDLGPEGLAHAGLRSDGAMVVAREGSSSCSLSDPSTVASLFSDYPEPFKAVCSGSLFVRSRPSSGYKSTVEQATDLLRKAGPLGEALINFRKDLIPVSGDDVRSASSSAATSARSESAVSPPAATLLPGLAVPIHAPNLGIPTGSETHIPGRWEPALGAPGVFISVAAPSMAPDTDPAREAPSSLAYLMALDLGSLEPRYSVGVDHPKVDWSSHPPGEHPGPGPDGFGTLEPFDRAGVAPPWAIPRLAAVFSGGFKREHSAFRQGPLSTSHHGSHYGFAEGGVVLSSLNPGLMTFFQRQGETPELRLWSEQDAAAGPKDLLFARQNGLPLLENGQRGKRLAISYLGNWSGNHEGNPETMRSALCRLDHSGKHWLVYAVFSKAVPSDMAQLLQAYGCQSAMQLDMNSPALTYAAVVSRDAQGKATHLPLLASMRDSHFQPALGRFAATPDTRDFFYFQSKR